MTHSIENNRTDSDPADSKKAPLPQSLTFWQMLSSTLAAALGVQSSKNRERDFTHGKASHFILMGIGFTLIFVIAIVAIVSLVLP